MRHLVFVPKRDYDIDTSRVDGGPVTSLCSLELSLITGETNTATEPARATAAIESPADKDLQQDGATPASPAPASPPTASTLLPDAIDVFISGSHAPSNDAREDGDVGDAAYWSPASVFTRLDIPLVRILSLE